MSLSLPYLCDVSLVPLIPDLFLEQLDLVLVDGFHLLEQHPGLLVAFVPFLLVHLLVVNHLPFLELEDYSVDFTQVVHLLVPQFVVHRFLQRFELLVEQLRFVLNHFHFTLHVTLS